MTDIENRIDVRQKLHEALKDSPPEHVTEDVLIQTLDHITPPKSISRDELEEGLDDFRDDDDVCVEIRGSRPVYSFRSKTE